MWVCAYVCYIWCGGRFTRGVARLPLGDSQAGIWVSGVAATTSTARGVASIRLVGGHVGR